MSEATTMAEGTQIVLEKLDDLGARVEAVRAEVHKQALQFTEHKATTEARLHAVDTVQTALDKMLSAVARIEATVGHTDMTIKGLAERVAKVETRVSAVEKTQTKAQVAAAHADGETKVIGSKLIWLIAILVYLAPHALDRVFPKNAAPASEKPRVCAFTPAGKLVCAEE